MKISIIVPINNHIFNLEDCLRGLEEQSYKDFEVLIINDQVKELDVLEKMLLSYKEALDIKLISLEKGKTGVAAARNRGIEEAQGEYIYFLDSDDYLLSDTLKNLTRDWSYEEKGINISIKASYEILYGKSVSTNLGRAAFISKRLERSLKEEGRDSDFEEEADESNDDQESQDSQDNQESQEMDLQEPELQEPELFQEDKSKIIAFNEYISFEIPDGKRVNVTLRSCLSEKDQRMEAYKKLVLKKNTFGRLSVLGMLIKRELILESGLRFDENSVYYSDQLFLIKLLQRAKSFKYISQAIYCKKRSNDTVNFPTLSQIHDENRFPEYARAFVECRDAAEDEKLKEYLNIIISRYVIKSFSIKMRRSDNPRYSGEYFNMMEEILHDIPKKFFNRYKKPYQRKLLLSVHDGNLSKTKLLVNYNLAKKKFKKMLSSKASFCKTWYVHVFSKLTMKDNYVICESFFGKSYSDSPKYIYEYICKNHPGKLKFVWVIDDLKTEIPYNPIKIKRYSLRYAYYLARCKYYIFNMRQPEWVKKKDGNIILETWHGIPMKKLMFDQKDVTGPNQRYKEQVYNQTRLWDYLVSPNPYCTEIFRRCFMFGNEIIETGYPRNDILHQNNGELARNLKMKLGIPEGKKVIMYAPTFRDDEFYKIGQYKFNLALDLELLRRELSDEYVLLMRTHYIIADALDITGMEDFIINVSKYNDIMELYLITDILISDYSSVAFDFANLRRPMLFFTYDLEKYRDTLRGFYIDIEEELPGPLLLTSQEVVSAVKNIDKLTLKYAEKYNCFYEKYCGLEDGHSAERVVKKVFKL